MATPQTLNERTSSYANLGHAKGRETVGPPPLPYLGWRLRKSLFWRDPVGSLDAIYKEYGLMSSFGVEPPQYVFSFSPEYNKRLTEETDLFHWAARRQLVAGHPVLSSLSANIGNMDGDEHETRRILMTPAFHAGCRERWHDDIVAQTERFAANWSGSSVRNVHDELNRLVHSIALKIVLGVGDSRTVEHTYDLVRTIYDAAFSLGTMLLPYDLPGTPYRRMLRSVTKMVAFLQGVIAEKRGQKGEPTDMLGAIMSADTAPDDVPSDAALVSEAYNIMNHETTMSALIWALILIVQHPRVHAEVVDELTGVLRGEAPTVQELARLPLLDRVVKESLRLMPPQAFTRRFSTEPCSLIPYQLPKGVMVILSSYITHRLPEIYSDPYRFRPERWETIKPSAYEYFPFGTGARACLGKALAVMEIKIVLAILLQRFRLRMVPGQRLDRKLRNVLLLQPAGAVHMEVSPQDRLFRPSAITGNICEMVDFA